ncbi:MAG: hypothetical protein JWO30_5008 [Fibrobacteres bacterium]|nr:hypothetical protein [Fibrobacterota bacterium]
MKTLYWACAIAAAALIGLTAFYRSEPDTLYGIADTKEIAVSSRSPVEIRRIYVEQGRMVARGDTLLELYNPELEQDISRISHELNELRTRKTAHATLSKSEIRQLRAEQQERVGGLRDEIRELEAQLELNKQLVSQLRSLDKDKASAKQEDDAGNPVRIKLESLRKMLELAGDPSRIYVDRLSNALSSSGEPLVEQVRRLEDELGMLQEEKSGLIMTAQIHGLIGSVNFKEGEKVPAFAPILTLHAESPSFVRGYIHEDVYSRVAVNQKVTVQSSHDGKSRIAGEVVGVGARIVEYPERLRKRSDIQIWGREIIVRLPPDNRFLLGEKVTIALSGPETKAPAPVGASPNASASAGLFPSPARPAAAQPISGSAAPSASTAADTGAELPGIEASGLLYLEDLGRFLVISDDTPKKAPVLFLLDSAFRKERETGIIGLEKMNDMESITAGDDGSIYVASSQSLNKKGKIPDTRKLLVRAKRKGWTLELNGKVSLTDLLENAARENPGEEWAGYVAGAIADSSLDIEGMAWRDGALLLGCKRPLLGGKAVILRLADAKAVLDGTAAGRTAAASGKIGIWKAVELKDLETGVPCGISDLLMVEGDAYILSTGSAGGAEDRGGHLGELWRLRAGASRPERLRGFGGRKPEGIAYRAADKSLFIAFDNGSGRPSRIQKLGAVP